MRQNIQEHNIPERSMMTSKSVPGVGVKVLSCTKDYKHCNMLFPLRNNINVIRCYNHNDYIYNSMSEISNQVACLLHPHPLVCRLCHPHLFVEHSAHKWARQIRSPARICLVHWLIPLAWIQEAPVVPYPHHNLLVLFSQTWRISILHKTSDHNDDNLFHAKSAQHRYCHRTH